MKALLAGFALLMTASAAMAQQQDSGWYIGAGGGRTGLQHACSYFGSLAPTCDDESVGWKVFLGMPVYKYTSMELQYTDAGEAKLASASGTDTLEINPRMASLFLKVEVPLAVQGRLGVFFKAGANYFDTQYTRTGVFLAFPESDDGIEPAIGAGVTWRGWNKLSVRGEWENFNDPVVGNGDGSTDN